MAERGYQNLNTSVLRQISKALENDPAADIEHILNKVYTLYATLRRGVGERQLKRRGASSKDAVESAPLKKAIPSYPEVLLPLASAIQSHHSPAEPHLLELRPLSCPLAHSIIHPFSPLVHDILEITDRQGFDPPSAVLRCVLSGVPIWQNRSRAIVQVGEGVVVKIGQGLDHDEHGVLQFLEDHVSSVAAPRPLGLITVGSMSFLFMTKIPGATLETRWPSLSSEAKAHIRAVLDRHLIALRKIEHPNGSPFGSPVGHRLCKDVRRDDRLSASPIYCEDQFNDFLLNSTHSRTAPGHKKWLRSLLRTDHRIVFTHADFHPRNVMVVDGPGDTVELSGILDWETSGFYPEYWEELKALNTRSVKDTSDWWDFLPPCILGYGHDVVLDRVIESTVVY